jgi:hypothetical protein
METTGEARRRVLVRLWRAGEATACRGADRYEEPRLPLDGDGSGGQHDTIEQAEVGPVIAQLPEVLMRRVEASLTFALGFGERTVD